MRRERGLIDPKSLLVPMVRLRARASLVQFGATVDESVRELFIAAGDVAHAFDSAIADGLREDDAADKHAHPQLVGGRLGDVAGGPIFPLGCPPPPRAADDEHNAIGTPRAATPPKADPIGEVRALLDDPRVPAMLGKLVAEMTDRALNGGRPNLQPIDGGKSPKKSPKKPGDGKGDK